MRYRGLSELTSGSGIRSVISCWPAAAGRNTFGLSSTIWPTWNSCFKVNYLSWRQDVRVTKLPIRLRIERVLIGLRDKAVVFLEATVLVALRYFARGASIKHGDDRADYESGDPMIESRRRRLVRRRTYRFVRLFDVVDLNIGSNACHCQSFY